MKYNLTIGKNRSWVESLALGFIGGLIGLVLLPVFIILAGVLIVVFPVMGILGLVVIEPK